MRADRLLSIMMILQTRGKMTAAALARDLEVSERTIYRDMDALSSAGVPVYADNGPGGGYALLDNYRTRLTGLHEGEIRALFLLTIPGPFADLGSNQQLQAAILKLTSALPGSLQAEAAAVRQRLHLDSAGWFQIQEAAPYLKQLQEATWQDQRLRIQYRRRDQTIYHRIIEPYGLVAKAAIWYLVAGTERGFRVYRVARISHIEATAEQFARPSTFDLAAFWTEWVAAYESGLPRYPVKLRISPDLANRLPAILGKEVRLAIQQATIDAVGWRTIEHTFEKPEEAQAYILSLGPAVEVLSPEELRKSVREKAGEIVAFYDSLAL